MDQTTDDDNLAWHYTNGTGLISILANHTLWASSAAFLNDSNELLTGSMGLVSEFDKLKPELEPYEIEWIENLVRKRTQISRREWFILSACQDGDNLTMWRLYGDQQVSYAVGLDRSVELWPREQRKISGSTPARQSGLGVFWQDVSYTQELARNALELYRNAVKPRNWGAPDEDLEQLAHDFTEEIFLSKDSGFVDERETRIVTQIGSQRATVKHRAGRFGLVPYVELGIPRELAPSRWPELMDLLPIAGIQIGPSQYGEDAQDSLKSLMDVSGYGSVPVKLSKTPYR